VDFDGTIVTEDIAERALSRFAAPGWMRFNGLLAEGKINVDECVRSEYGMITAHSKKEMIAYLRDHYHLRAGFRRFLQDCRFGRLEVAIVSAGLDFCIMDTFQTFGIDMPRLICPRSRLTRQGTIRLTFPRYRWPGSRDFKEDAVFSYKERGLRVAYVGDGAGDFHAAEASDRVFAIEGSALEAMCRAKGVPYRAVKTFAPVTRDLGVLGAGLQV